MLLVQQEGQHGWSVLIERGLDSEIREVREGQFMKGLEKTLAFILSEKRRPWRIEDRKETYSDFHSYVKNRLDVGATVGTGTPTGRLLP